jgi:predicted nucleic acid-binding protein
MTLCSNEESVVCADNLDKRENKMYNADMVEKIKRVYVDTSAVYGAVSQKFGHDTQPFWEAVKSGKICVVMSDVLADEIERAPQSVREFYRSIPEVHIERVESTDESNVLAERYIAEKVIGQSSLSDCKHIALATLANADVLVSWNFKHIVNVDRIRGYNGINMKLGYPQIDIRTPYEVHHDET